MSDIEVKLRERLTNLIKHPLAKEIAEALEQNLERIEKAKISESKDVAKISENMLKKLGFWSDLCKHPIVRKSVDWGNLSRQCKRQPEYERLLEKISEIIKRGAIYKDYVDITNLLERLIGIMIDYLILNVKKPEEGLRPLQAPGSVSRDEARNLYFGETYDSKTLVSMVLRLCDSFPIGNDIGIYFEDDNVRQELMQRFEKKYGSRIELPLNELKITRYERQKPYIVFMKFLLWLYQEYEKAKPEEEKSLKDLLDRLKNTSAIMYFAPGREKEKWCMISVPRIDWFASRWLEDREQKAKLEELGEKLNTFMTDLERAGKREVRNIIELIAHNYELLSQQLLTFGTVDYTSLRNIVNVVTELSISYGIKTSMVYCKWLT